jgi:hypothetical protein
MKRLLATLAVLVVTAVSVSACAVYEPRPVVVAYAPAHHVHPPYYYGERHYHRW